MTDRFEEAVRQAARGLGATAEMPTYHEAWQRGRRRRFIKRSALAAAGALVFIAALSVNLGRLPGTNPGEVDDIAVGIEAATPTIEAPTALATTAPIDAPTTAPTESAVVAVIPTTEPDPAPNPTSAQQSTASPSPSAEPTLPPAAVITPQATPIPTLPADPSPQPSVTTLEAAPTPTPQVLPVPDGTAIPEGATGTQLVPDTSATSPQPGDEQLSQIASAGSGQRPDAAIVERQAATPELNCDIDLDGLGDASCELLADYRCTGDDDITAGYGAFDDDGDGVIESCRAAGLTMCDTTGDGFGDTPCIIELSTDADAATSGPPSGE